MDNKFRTMPKMMPNRMGLSDALGQYGTMKKAQPSQEVGIGRFEQAQQPQAPMQQPAIDVRPRAINPQMPTPPKTSMPLPKFQPMPQMRAPSMPLPKPSPLFNSSAPKKPAGGGLLGIGGFEQNQIKNMPKRRF